MQQPRVLGLCLLRRGFHDTFLFPTHLSASLKYKRASEHSEEVVSVASRFYTKKPRRGDGNVSYCLSGKAGWGLQPSPDREASGTAKPSLLLHKQGNGTLLGYGGTPRKEGTGLELAAHSSTTSRDTRSASLRSGLAESTSVRQLPPAWQKIFIPRVSGVLPVGFNLQHFPRVFLGRAQPCSAGSCGVPCPAPERTRGALCCW